MNGRHQQLIGCYSPTISPKPTDWGENIHLTGNWFLDQASDWHPPVHLINFLNAGAPPVYVGFGSMANRTPRKMSQLVLEALTLTDQRDILAAAITIATSDQTMRARATTLGERIRAEDGLQRAIELIEKFNH